MGEQHPLRALTRAAPRTRWVLKLTLDGAMYAAAVVAAYTVRFEQLPVEPWRTQMVWLLPLLPLLRLGASRLVGGHRTSWRLFGLPEAMLMLRALGIVSTLLLIARLAVPVLGVEYANAVVPLGVIALELLFAGTGTLGLRVAARLLDEHLARESVRTRTTKAPRRALLVGAGRAGRMAVRELRNHPEAGYEPVGFLDDDPLRRQQVIEGVAVLGTTHDVLERAHDVGAEVLVLTMPAAARSQVREVVDRCRRTGLPVQTVPGLYDLISGRVGITKIRSVQIEDLLGRDVVELDAHVWSQVQDGFRDKCILVTGAGGSIGSELCRQLAALDPARLVLFEASENNLFDIENEVRASIGDRAVPVLADVRDAAEVERALAEHRPHVVFHAAAYKHVPLMELHVAAAIDNNVRGTRTVAEAADAHGVERFLLVSTDKAVNPSSVMGASKRVAEMLVHARNASSRTRFCSVRFGNVLGSRGSVLQTFQKQIEQGGPVTVTHPDITRFFMTIPEAVRLLIQACAISDGGEIFLLDMGEPVRILDMARQMIRLAGLTEDDVPVAIVGLRPGEKLHEELLRGGEHEAPSRVSGIMLAQAAEVQHIDLAPWVQRLERAASERDLLTIRRMLAVGTGYASDGEASVSAQATKSLALRSESLEHA